MLRNRVEPTMGRNAIKSTQSLTRTSFPWAPEWVSGTSEQLNAAKWANEASGAEQANGWAVQPNGRTKEWMAQYTLRRFHSHSTHSDAMRRFKYSQILISVDNNLLLRNVLNVNWIGATAFIVPFCNFYSVFSFLSVASWNFQSFESSFCHSFFRYEYRDFQRK